MDKDKRNEIIDNLFGSSIKEKSVEVTNSNIFTLDEWLSFSKERQESITIFICLTQNIKEIDHTKITFDEETTRFVTIESLKSILKKV